MPDMDAPSDEFVRRLTESQAQLLGFIMAGVGDYADASDILQQTNIVLLRKCDELRDLEAFLPWAITVAKFKVLSFARDRSRERLLFAPDVIAAMCDTAQQQAEFVPERLVALRECLAKLPQKNVRLLQQRYTYNTPLEEMARVGHCTVDSIKGRLKRLRQLLSRCIDGRLDSLVG